MDYVRTVPIVPDRSTATGRALMDRTVVHIPDVAADTEITRVFLNLISNGFYAATKRAAQAGSEHQPILKAVTRSLARMCRSS